MAPRVEIGMSRLPELLEKAGKNQIHLADYLGVSEPYISRVIAGKDKLSVVNYKRTADFLNCRMEDLNDWIYCD